MRKRNCGANTMSPLITRIFLETARTVTMQHSVVALPRYHLPTPKPKLQTRKHKRTAMSSQGVWCISGEDAVWTTGEWYPAEHTASSHGYAKMISAHHTGSLANVENLMG